MSVSCTADTSDGGSGCAPSSCPQGRIDCNKDIKDGCETDISADPLNCGACGAACPGAAQGQAQCIDRQCSTCPRGRGDCDKDPTNGCEANLSTSADQCGACGVTCPAVRNGQRGCLSGRCGVLHCDSTFRDCNNDASDGCESNVQGDPLNCGACGHVCAGVENGKAECQSGSCMLSACTAPFRSCRGGPVLSCETNVSLDVNNCGYCGNVCPKPLRGIAACKDGLCAVGTCDAGYQDCNGKFGDGCEISTRDDSNNCGACEIKCPTVQNGSLRCENSECKISCTPGFGDCDMDKATGCESDLVNGRPAGCGTCGNICTLSHATSQCRGGKCGVLSCDPPYGNCDGDDSTGCEVNLSTSALHCLTCGNRCRAASNAGTVTAYKCQGSGCAVDTCASPTLDCDGQVFNGCEVNPGSDVNNCGGCGARCLVRTNAGTVARTECLAGECRITCLGNFRDCNNDISDGCEIDTASNAGHCGGCGKVCQATSNAGTVFRYACVIGQCEVNACNDPNRDCDGGFANGCEIDISANASHCNACNASCLSRVISNQATVASTTCTNRTCGIQCKSGTADCDLQVSTGCETPLGNTFHCRACGDRCLSSFNPERVLGYACQATGCAVTACLPPYDDCNGGYVDGCEADTATSTSHCGGCNQPCTLTANPGTVTSVSCDAGACKISCQGGRKDCDSDYKNGCEVDLSSAAHCGDCNRACTITANPGTVNSTSCVAGACKISCKLGRGDCDGDYKNGCEVDTGTSIVHCGACDNTCTVTANEGTVSGLSCTAGACKITCQSGQADCNSNYRDGCEANLSSAQTCGSCGNTCTAARPLCMGGKCCDNMGKNCA